MQVRLLSALWPFPDKGNGFFYARGYRFLIDTVRNCSRSITLRTTTFSHHLCLVEVRSSFGLGGFEIVSLRSLFQFIERLSTPPMALDAILCVEDRWRTIFGRRRRLSAKGLTQRCLRQRRRNLIGPIGHWPKVNFTY
ncbi:hypothetical protein C2E31_24100 [Rhodopirellula baltica]|nr:hypothetical protein C2E31_24100 [Rhodopirellula baltica]